MKVCFVCHLPNLTGANRSLLDMIDGLDNSIVTPFVLLNGHGPIESELKKRKIKYKIEFYSPATNSDNKVKNLIKWVLNTAPANFISVNLIKKVLIEEKVELVHNNTFIVGAAMQAAKELSIPYICHIREFIWEDHHRKFFHPQRQQCLLENATKVLAITDSIKAKFQPTCPKEITAIYDGVDVNEYLLPVRRVLENKNISILMTGRIAPGKGQLDSIKAVEKLFNEGYKNLSLKIVGGIGDEEYYRELKKYVSDRKLEFVDFLEFTNDLKVIREKSDIGLTCSTFEALGRVTIENMLSSMLAIGTNTAGTSEIITDNKTGFLYKPGDYEELAEKILFAINNRDLSNSIIRNAYYEAQERFDNKKYSDMILNIYKDILTTRETDAF